MQASLSAMWVVNTAVFTLTCKVSTTVLSQLKLPMLAVCVCVCVYVCVYACCYIWYMLTVLGEVDLKLTIVSTQHASPGFTSAVGPDSAIQPGSNCGGSRATAEEPLACQD